MSCQLTHAITEAWAFGITSVHGYLTAKPERLMCQSNKSTLSVFYQSFIQTYFFINYEY